MADWSTTKPIPALPEPDVTELRAAIASLAACEHDCAMCGARFGHLRSEVCSAVCGECVEATAGLFVAGKDN